MFEKWLRAILIPVVLAALIGLAGPAPLPAAADEDRTAVTVTVSGVGRVMLAFVTPAPEFVAGDISGRMTVAVLNSRGDPSPVTSPVTLLLTTTSAGGRFLSFTPPITSITSVTIPTGSNTASFYYGDGTIGASLITVAESPSRGWQDAQQNVSVTAPPGPPEPPPPPPPAPPPSPPSPPEPPPSAASQTKEFIVDVIDGAKSVVLTNDGTVVRAATVTDTEGKVVLTLEEGDRIITGQEDPPDRLVVEESRQTVAIPRALAAVSPVYDVYAIVKGVHQSVKFDPPITISFEYDVAKVGANVGALFVAYFDSEQGWVSIEPPKGYIAEAGRISAQIAHLTLFAVMTSEKDRPPARFELSRLFVNPKDARPGDMVTISGVIANVGGMVGEYVLPIIVPGLVETRQVITLSPGKSQEITLSVVATKPGEYEVEVGNLGGVFRVIAPSPPPVERSLWWLWMLLAGVAVLAVGSGGYVYARQRAGGGVVVSRRPSLLAGGAMKVNSFSISPRLVAPGEAVTITAEAVNTGAERVTYSLVLKVSGVAEAFREVSLNPRQRERVAFTIARTRPGAYDVDLEGLRGTFTVRGP